jgi:fructose/tagatose bisphosphate aldolase
MSEKKAKLEQIKDGIEKLNLPEDKKSNSYKIIEEWYAEDRAMSELYADLAKVSETIKEYLSELGLV